jgi:hypothetical protein
MDAAVWRGAFCLAPVAGKGRGHKRFLGRHCNLLPLLFATSLNAQVAVDSSTSFPQPSLALDSDLTILIRQLAQTASC